MILKINKFAGFFILLLAVCIISTSCGSTATLSVDTKCAQIVVGKEADIDINGSIVFIGEENYLFDTGTSLKKSLLDDNTEDWQSLYLAAVAPDFKKVAYTIGNYTETEHKFINSELRIFDVNEPSVVKHISSSALGEGNSLIKWANENQLLLQPHLFRIKGGMVGYGIPPEEKRPFGTLYLYNPLSDQIDEIQPSFSELYPARKDDQDWTLPPILNPVSYHYLNYNASISRALLYLSDTQGMRFVLWDVDSKRLLWESSTSNPMIEPKWSLSGKHVMLAPNAADIMVLDESGHETVYNNGDLGYPIAFGGSWSPDGKQIAFWAATGDTLNETELVVLDLATNHLTNYCIGPGGTEPIWSPDGKNIVVTSVDDKTKPNSQSNWKTVAVNLEKGIAITIVENAFEKPIGWLWGIEQKR